MSTEHLILHPIDTSGDWPPHIITVKKPTDEKDKQYGVELCRLFPEGKNIGFKYSDSQRLDILLYKMALYEKASKSPRNSEGKEKSTEDVFVELRDKVKNGQDIELPVFIWEAFLNNHECFPGPPQVERPPDWEILRAHIFRR